MNRTKKYLLLRHVKIHNANAFSSPLTIGFPAMTAWLGAMHALERKLRQHEALSDIRLTKLAVSCHDFNLQTYKGPGDYVNSVIITSNPLRKKRCFLRAASVYRRSKSPLDRIPPYGGRWISAEQLLDFH